MEGVMAEYTVRVYRENELNKLQVVIHGNEIVAEGELRQIGSSGHPDYYSLYDDTLLRVLKS